MKKTYITPSSQALDFYMEDCMLSLSVNLHQSDDTRNDNEACSNRQDFGNSGIWDCNNEE